MRKFIVLAALSLMFSATAQAKQKAVIIVSAYNEITIIDKATKIPANFLFTDKICYTGTPEEAEQIIQKTIKNRTGFTLVDIRVWDNLGKIILFAQIETDRQATVEVVLKPCSK
ncbi:hypothetical protein [Bdellovibrio bacteriovorus]|uniref:Uncharacterized protein n=1 Tax=Bdellovibrio bacteriovorus TaxID=959 RepID=A0A1Z3N4Y4_BDEBC|nr:hypothetical protein [Bdellovibrio bacteriovorus]ASD62471.1 hypothetical protein B9G79_02260 [Bdellovibrio bacteriovorus]